MKIDDFLNILHEMNCNKVFGDADFDELFGKNAPFAIVCNKCGSMDVEIIGEMGRDYGGMTGYDPGSTTVKCNGCGAAITVWNL